MTDQELSIKTGVLNQKFNLIKLFRIVDISVERTFLQRLFGMSTLVLNTHDNSSGDGVVKLINIIDGFGVREIMQGAVDDSRRMNGMTTREFIGGDSFDGAQSGFDGGFGGMDGDFEGDMA